MRMTVAKRWFTVLFAALFILSPTVSLAAEGVPSPDEVRYIDRDGASSDCIGDPRTPVCAIETWLACKLRGDGRLCALVDRRSPRGAEWLLTDRIQYIIRWGGICGDVVSPDMARYCPAQIPAAVIKVDEMDTNGQILATNTYRLLKDEGEWRIVDFLVQGKEMRLYKGPDEGLY